MTLTGSVLSADCAPLSSPSLLGDPATDPRYAEGRRVVRWIERNCRYGEGDRFGEPVQLEPFQVRFLLLLFETLPDGSRRRRRALLEVPKGNGKTPMASWVAAYELVHRDSALIPVAAASYKQADLLFGDLRACVAESPSLLTVLEPFESEIQVRNGPGRAYKVAAAAGTNDGQRPSTFLADEIHEWHGSKERVHLVIANGCSKRADSLVFNTTTPGADPDSLAGRLHEYGLKVNSGEIVDDAFLFVWYGCPEDRYDLDDPAQLRAAIRDANPAADRFLNVEDVAARRAQIPRHEFSRYHLGQWGTISDEWLPTGAWDLCGDDDTIGDGADVVLAFDGSHSNDSTGIVACSLETPARLQVVGLWERPKGARADWTVPILDVEEALREACRRWHVVEVAADPFRWARSLEILEGEGLPVVEFPQSPARMTPATARLYEAIVNQQLRHNRDPRLTRHLGNSRLRQDARGQRLTKDTKDSPRKIDLAVCAVMALDAAARHLPDESPGSVWTVNEFLAPDGSWLPEEDDE